MSATSAPLTRTRNGPSSFEAACAMQVCCPSCSVIVKRSCGSAALAMAESCGKTWRMSFTVPGTYKYVCTFHEDHGMMGTVIVKPASTEPSPY